jgi:hypothetical protein
MWLYDPSIRSGTHPRTSNTSFIMNASDEFLKKAAVRHPCEAYRQVSQKLMDIHNKLKAFYPNW